MEDIILEAKKINKYFNEPVKSRVLNDINFSINKSEFVAITGKSGCGKSTLLYILSTMDTDYEGDVIINHESMKGKADSKLAHIRNEKIGFVFQFHYLINEFNVLKNVMLPALKLSKYSHEEIEAKALNKLQMLEIDNLADKKVTQLSGGEKQRVAIARAMINDPQIIMGDEPTGNLDRKNTEIVFEIFRKLSHDYQQTLLVVTHDTAFAERTDRIIKMDDGRIVS